MTQTGSRISAADDTMIVRAAIHPAIGIGRIGNSIHAFFYGPEVSYPTPAAPGFYRDAIGALKRQAARFRIYGYNAALTQWLNVTADLQIIGPGTKKALNAVGQLANVDTAVVAGARLRVRF